MLGEQEILQYDKEIKCTVQNALTTHSDMWQYNVISNGLLDRLSQIIYESLSDVNDRLNSEGFRITVQQSMDSKPTMAIAIERTTEYKLDALEDNQPSDTVWIIPIKIN